MKHRNVWWPPLVILIVLTIFFTLLFYGDNKYQTPPPYGKSGIISLSRQDLEQNNPVFLIDGWLLTDERTVKKPTYIGEFSNLQRGDLSVSPHGHARYQLTLRYDGPQKIVAVDFPQLSSSYTVSLDGIQLAQGSGNGYITFLLTPGDHVLVVETSSRLGYYSGMYFPPSLGTIETLRQKNSVQNFAYALAFVLSLVLAVFTLFLWQTGGKLSRWLGLLCCCYALYMFRHFVFLFSMPLAQYWFLVQSLALYCLCFCVVQLTVLASDASGDRIWQWIKMILLILSMILMTLCLFTSKLPWIVYIHSRLTDIYYLFIFCSAVFFSARGITAQNRESRYTLAGCSVFGVGLLTNLLCSNRFEPIRFFWQFEWCGLFLVLLFGAMMVSRSRRILRENKMLTNHLEEEVKKRTKEVMLLLDERKAFFSDMAHDLKAPVFATRSFIEAIRRSGVGVDMELCGYIDQAEIKLQEMVRRLEGLSTINALDKIEEEPVHISLQKLLAEIYATHHAEAMVSSVYLFVNPPKQEAFLKAQPEKLNILFENLIFNALRATPRNGSIIISAQSEDSKIRITVEDTGCGIPPEELPFIFQRFYVGKHNRNTGTGLGLYIVHSIVTELGGSIHVQSAVGKGTKFIMEFPQDPEM